MVHNFESWRKSTQSKYTALAHFHKVEDQVSFPVIKFIQQLIVARVNVGTKITITLDESTTQSLLSFCEQFTHAYIHPRSTSAKYAMFSSSPANHSTL